MLESEELMLRSTSCQCNVCGKHKHFPWQKGNRTGKELELLFHHFLHSMQKHFKDNYLSRPSCRQRTWPFTQNERTGLCPDAFIIMTLTRETMARETEEIKEGRCDCFKYRGTGGGDHLCSNTYELLSLPGMAPTPNGRGSLHGALLCLKYIPCYPLEICKLTCSFHHQLQACPTLHKSA